MRSRSWRLQTCSARRVSGYAACAPEVRLAGGEYVETPPDGAIRDGTLVTGFAWPAHPQWLCFSCLPWVPGWISGRANAGYAVALTRACPRMAPPLAAQSGAAGAAAVADLR